MPNFCKVRMYLNAALVISSGLILLAVAAIRYLIVCHPLKKRLTLTQAKVVCVIIAIVSFFISIPYGLIHGTQTRKTPNPNITARYCQVDDSYINTIWPRLNSGFFIFVFTICSSAALYFYICIARTTWKRRKTFASSERRSSESHGSNSKDTEGFHLSEKLDNKHHNEEDDLSDDSELSSKRDSQRIEDNKISEIRTHPVVVSQNSAEGGECNQNRSFECSELHGTLGRTSTTTASNKPSQCPELIQYNKYVYTNRDNLGDNNRDTHLDEVRERAESDLFTKQFPQNKNERFKGVKTQTSLESNNRSFNSQTTTRKRQATAMRRRMFERTSLMMFVITLVFFIAFLPFLGLNVFLALAPEKVAALKGASLAMYQLFLCSYLLNSAANCIVYSFFDRRFRKECLIFLKLSKRSVS